MALTSYLTDVETLLHDFNLQFYGSPLSLTTLINRARQRIAAEGQCVRVLIPKSGNVTSVTVSAGGTGYTGATTVTGGGGTGNTFTPTIVGGVIQSIAVSGSSGINYQQGNSLTITDTVGTGATATVNCSDTAFTTAGQETYSFSTYNTIAQNTSGVNQIQGIFSIAVNQGTTTPVMRQATFTYLQARMRAYNTGYQSYPEVFANYGQGTSGSFYLWPIPSQTYGMDLDTYCLPVNLANDSTPEAIPFPWTDAVQYYAAYLALLNAQRTEDSKMMLGEYKRVMAEARAFSTPPFIPSMYGDQW